MFLKRDRTAATTGANSFRWLKTLSLAAMLIAGLGLHAYAQAGLTALSVSGPPASMVVTTSIAGNQPTTIVNTATTYSVTAKRVAGIKKIVVQLSAPMPPNTTLTVDLVPVTGSVSVGPVTLDMTARDLLVNISRENNTLSSINYTFSATVAAGVVPSQTRTVTFTLLNYP